MLSSEDRENIKVAIAAKIKRTESDIEYLVEVTKPVGPENAIGRISRMDAINNKSVNDAALAKSRNTLIGLKNAIVKIDEPDFGKCAKCGGDIQIGRLKLMPESTRCMKCVNR